MMHHDLYAQRRQKLLAQLPPKSLALVPAAPMLFRNRDVAYRYRQDSHMLYYTGCLEPDAMLVLSTMQSSPETYFFCQPYDATKAQWEGPMLGKSGMADHLGLADCDTIDQLGPFLAKHHRDVNHWWTLKNPQIEHAWWYTHLPSQPPTWHWLDDMVAAQRIVKCASEIICIQKAVDATIAGHRAVIQATQPGMTERQLYGRFLQALCDQGISDEAYTAIVATGPHACVLHYTALQATCQKNELLLLDAGAEHQGYAGDLTRTVPVEGTFSGPQHDLYSHVLDIQTRLIEQVTCGVSWSELNRWTQQWTHEALCTLGILTPNDAQLVSRYAPHGVGHWLGLDVHDVGFSPAQTRDDPLPSGCVITIEPGIYIPNDDATVAPHWRGMGVRIEDDLWLDGTQTHVLSAALEKTPKALEALMQT